MSFERENPASKNNNKSNNDSLVEKNLTILRLKVEKKQLEKQLEEIKKRLELQQVQHSKDSELIAKKEQTISELGNQAIDRETERILQIDVLLIKISNLVSENENLKTQNEWYDSRLREFTEQVAEKNEKLEKAAALIRMLQTNFESELAERTNPLHKQIAELNQQLKKFEAEHDSNQNTKKRKMANTTQNREPNGNLLNLISPYSRLALFPAELGTPIALSTVPLSNDSHETSDPLINPFNL